MGTCQRLKVSHYECIIALYTVLSCVITALSLLIKDSEWHLACKYPTTAMRIYYPRLERSLYVDINAIVTF